jgi:transcriptional regulator GlxA family with amidase domain
MNTTPARYLWQFRIERGAAMLGETGHTVAEIAYRCGFQNPFHFSRLVKQHFGQSPKEIRRHAWSKNQRREQSSILETDCHTPSPAGSK